jgi:hypothetical protein
MGFMAVLDAQWELLASANRLSLCTDIYVYGRRKI